MRHSAGLVIVAAALALGACGGQEEGAGGVTAEESQQLNEAAAMLDESLDNLGASDGAEMDSGEEESAGAEEAPAEEEEANAQ